MSGFYFDPQFILGISFLLVAVSLTAVLITAVPALQEVSRAARSAEKLFDTLRQEIPPTLEAIRLTGMEIGELTEDIDESIKSARSTIQQVDRSISNVKKQTVNLQVGTRSFFAGFKAAWQTWQNPNSNRVVSLEARENQIVSPNFSRTARESHLNKVETEK